MWILRTMRLVLLWLLSWLASRLATVTDTLFRAFTTSWQFLTCRWMRKASLTLRSFTLALSLLVALLVGLRIEAQTPTNTPVPNFVQTANASIIQTQQAPTKAYGSSPNNLNCPSQLVNPAAVSIEYQAVCGHCLASNSLGATQAYTFPTVSFGATSTSALNTPTVTPTASPTGSQTPTLTPSPTVAVSSQHTVMLDELYSGKSFTFGSVTFWIYLVRGSQSPYGFASQSQILEYRIVANQAVRFEDATAFTRASYLSRYIGRSYNVFGYYGSSPVYVENDGYPHVWSGRPLYEHQAPAAGNLGFMLGTEPFYGDSFLHRMTADNDGDGDVFLTALELTYSVVSNYPTQPTIAATVPTIAPTLPTSTPSNTPTPRPTNTPSSYTGWTITADDANPQYHSSGIRAIPAIIRGSDGGSYVESATSPNSLEMSFYFSAPIRMDTIAVNVSSNSSSALSSRSAVFRFYSGATLVRTVTVASFAWTNGATAWGAGTDGTMSVGGGSGGFYIDHFNVTLQYGTSGSTAVRLREIVTNITWNAATPTPTVTATGTATATPTPIYTGTPAPEDYIDDLYPDGIDCSNPALYPPNSEPVTEISLPNWSAPLGVSCIDIVPVQINGFFENLQNITGWAMPDFFGVRICFKWYPLPAVVLFGLPIPTALFLIPVIAFVFRFIRQF